MYSAAHNSYTSLDSDFVGPQNKRSCSCIIFRGILKNLPSIDFGHLVKSTCLLESAIFEGESCKPTV